MGEDEFGPAGVGKSVRSLFDALGVFEQEFEIILQRMRKSAGNTLAGTLGGLLGAQSGGWVKPDLLRLLSLAGRYAETGWLTEPLLHAIGAADERSLEALRDEVRELLEQGATFGKREAMIAGGVEKLQERAARFEEAMGCLARVQGRCLAQVDSQGRRTEHFERLASRRDEHITRLIRDTVGQRAEMEKLANRIEDLGARIVEARKPSAASENLVEQGGRIEVVEASLREVKQLEKTRAQDMIDTLESIRDRLGRLEARSVEMSREARAKSGRLDALARHVAAVESRLSSAIGKGGQPVVAIAGRRVAQEANQVPHP